MPPNKTITWTARGRFTMHRHNVNLGAPPRGNRTAEVPEDVAADLCERFEDIERVEEEGESAEGEDEDGAGDEDGDEDESADDGEEEGPPFDPTELTVDELKDRLSEGEHSDDELDALANAEGDPDEDDGGRATAHDAIDQHRSDSDSDSSEESEESEE